ncbi:hypothetical protein B0H10DRAFT_1947169 [Mycena sp. CBHHK59/15]|nr:hypothetical protein B0H10DRAFT_1947169 [Mycena sp. CBHHK59/15]
MWNDYENISEAVHGQGKFEIGALKSVWNNEIICIKVGQRVWGAEENTKSLLDDLNSGDIGRTPKLSKNAKEFATVTGSCVVTQAFFLRSFTNLVNKKAHTCQVQILVLSGSFQALNDGLQA